MNCPHCGHGPLDAMSINCDAAICRTCGKVVTELELLAQRPRICAICLNEIVRANYNAHMRDAHGYTTLNIEERK